MRTLPQVYKLGTRYVVRHRVVETLAEVAAAIKADPTLTVGDAVREELAREAVSLSKRPKQ